MKDVPQEIDNLLLKIHDQLEDLKRDTRIVMDMQSELKKISAIEGIRKKLSLLDARYDDCYSVLVGYTKQEIDTRLQESNKQNADKSSNG